MAVAYATSLRSAVVPSIRSDGRFEATKRRYIDSYKLRHEILMSRLMPGADGDAAGMAATRSKGGGGGGLGGNGHSGFVTTDGKTGMETRHIPVFIFSVDSPYPVFIDTYYRARALSDMVLVVQSPKQQWESPFTCNGNPVHWNLVDPLDAALAATSALIGGILPPHISAQATHGNYAGAAAAASGGGAVGASQNWLWSVGEGPASYTSSQTIFSEVHRDSVQRTNAVQVRESEHERERGWKE